MVDALFFDAHADDVELGSGGPEARVLPGARGGIAR